MKKDQSFGIIPIFMDKTGKPRFLVVQQAIGHWTFPKGHKEKGETSQQTALRELQEETGISKCDILDAAPLEIAYIIPKNFESTYKEKGEEVAKTVTYFLEKVHKTSVTLKRSSGEIINYMWLPYETAHERITFSEAKSILAQAFQYITQTKL